MTNLGDLVVRKSYGGDVTFRVASIVRSEAVIKGTEFRLLADAPLSDLIRIDRDTPGETTQRARIKATESLKRLTLDRKQAGRAEPDDHRRGMVPDGGAGVF